MSIGQPVYTVFCREFSRSRARGRWSALARLHVPVRVYRARTHTSALLISSRCRYSALGRTLAYMRARNAHHRQVFGARGTWRRVLRARTWKLALDFFNTAPNPAPPP